MFNRCHTPTPCTNFVQLGETPSGLQKTQVAEGKVAQAIGGGDHEDDELQARLDSLRR
jgi:charged multivesicular body protein 2A